MATFEEITAAVEKGYVYYVEQIEAVRLKMVDGCFACNPCDLNCLGAAIMALEYDVATENNTSLTTSTYNLLLSILANFTGSFTADPTVVIPGQTIIVEQSYVTPVRLYFTAEAMPGIANWQADYASTFGNDPTFAVYLPTGEDDQYALFTGVSETLTSDGNGLLLTAYFDFGFPQTGYILIST